MTINIIAIILALVALIVTGIGFFASLRFYRDGMKLQSGANDALTKIAEKADSIHSQVGGMFEKTLDAAIGRSNQLQSDFEGINEQLEKTSNTIVNTALQQIGTAGEEERKRLSDVVNEQMGLIRERVQETRESAVQWADLKLPSQLASNLREKILAVLSSSKHPLSIEDIVLIIGTDEMIIRQELNTLSHEKRIKSDHDPKTSAHLYSYIFKMAPEPKT